VVNTMTSIPPKPLPVVLSLDPGTPGPHYGLTISPDEVITIPISLAADRGHDKLSWDELIGKR
jgi:hypothetical protein